MRLGEVEQVNKPGEVLAGIALIDKGGVCVLYHLIQNSPTFFGPISLFLRKEVQDNAMKFLLDFGPARSIMSTCVIVKLTEVAR